MDDTLTTPEVAAELGISVRRVLQLITAGRLKARQAGRYWLVQRSDLAAVCDRRRTGRPRKAHTPEVPELEPLPAPKPARKTTRKPKGK